MAAPSLPPPVPIEGPAAQEGPALVNGLHSAAGSSKSTPGGKKGGAHHLLRHELTPAVQQAAAAVLCAGGTPEEAAADIWKHQQRELRVVFEQVYGVPTSSCNNGWMRGKVLQALGLGAHWQPPREAVPPQEGSAERQVGGPGAEVSRFGRRVRRRRWDSSDYESADESSAGPAPSPRNAHRKPAAAKRARHAVATSASRSMTASPALPEAPAAGVAAHAWPPAAVQPRKAHPACSQPGGAAFAAAAAAGPQPHVRIVLRQPSSNGGEGLETVLVGPSAPLPAPCLLPPGPLPHAGSPTAPPSHLATSAPHPAADGPPASAAAPQLELPPVTMSHWQVVQPVQVMHPHPPAAAPPLQHQYLQQQQQQQHSPPPQQYLQQQQPPPQHQHQHQHSRPQQPQYLQQPQQQGGGGAPCACGGSDSATSGGASVDPSLIFYEEQQRMYQLRRQQVELELRQEIRQRLHTQQWWQEMAAYASAAATSATPPPLPPQATALLQVAPYAAAPPPPSTAAMWAAAHQAGHLGMACGHAAHAVPSLFTHHTAAMQAQVQAQQAQAQAQLLPLPPFFVGGGQALPSAVQLGAADGARLAAMFWPDPAHATAAAAAPPALAAAEAAHLAASPMHVLPPPGWEAHGALPTPFAAAAATAISQHLSPGFQQLPAGYGSGASDGRPLVAMHTTVSQELHTLYSAWQDGQLPRSASALTSQQGM